MIRYQALAIATRYWKPKTCYEDEIVKILNSRVADGDFIVISEKALSIAQNRIVDESILQPGLSAKFIAKFWMRVIWGFPLGVICRLGPRLLLRLRHYPYENGSRHKQVALQYAGLAQTLMFGSEGGIDGSNLPFSLVSLPLAAPVEVAKTIRMEILRNLGKKTTVLIVDTDKTYTFRNFHFTPRPNPMSGIRHRGGIIAYVVGRVLKLRKRPTPLSAVGEDLGAETALTVANVADRARGPGSGATVWDMAARFNVTATGVSWEMLEQVEHKPIVIVRRRVHP